MATFRIAFLYWASVLNLRTTYCAELVNFFEELAYQNPIQLTWLGCPDGKNAPRHPDLELVRKGGFDAFISNGIWNSDYLYELQHLKKPIVSLDYLTEGMAIDSVNFASKEPGETIGKLLAETGHKDVLFISPFRLDHDFQGSDPLEDTTSAERRSAVFSGLLGSDTNFWPVLPWRAYKPIDSTEQMAQLIDKMLSEMRRPPTALVTPSVDLAQLATAEFKRRDVLVPRDLSCISFHAPPDSRSDPVTVSTMQFSWKDMGEKAWSLLNDRLYGRVPANEPARHVKIPGKYVDRGTVINRKKK